VRSPKKGTHLNVTGHAQRAKEKGSSKKTRLSMGCKPKNKNTQTRGKTEKTPDFQLDQTRKLNKLLKTKIIPVYRRSEET